MAHPKISLPAHLQKDREVHVVISTHSGRHQALDYYDTELKPLLDSHETEHVTHRTTSADTVSELTKSIFIFNACKGVKQTIILLSGDGGVVDIVNTLTSILMREIDDSRTPSIFFKPVLVLIPMGTANALAWSSGIAKDPLKVLLEGRPKSLPSFQVRVSPGSRLVVDEGRGREEILASYEEEARLYGAVVFSWGLHASLVAISDTTEYRKHGLERFKMAAQELIKNPHIYQGIVKTRKEVDGNWQILTTGKNTSENSNQHTYIVATLVSNLEENFRISPQSQPMDGKMRLMGIGAESPEEIMRILMLAYQDGKHVHEPQVTYEEIESVRIEFQESEEQWRFICVDGRIVAVEENGWVEVKRLPAVGVDGRRVVELVVP